MRQGKGLMTRRRERRVGGVESREMQAVHGKEGATEARKGSDMRARDGQWKRSSRTFPRGRGWGHEVQERLAYCQYRRVEEKSGS